MKYLTAEQEATAIDALAEALTDAFFRVHNMHHWKPNAHAERQWDVVTPEEDGTRYGCHDLLDIEEMKIP